MTATSNFISSHTAVASTTLGLVAGLAGWLDPLVQVTSALWGFLAATAGTWYPLTAVLGTLSTQLPGVPPAIGQSAIVLGSLVYGVILALALARKARRYFDS